MLKRTGPVDRSLLLVLAIAFILRVFVLAVSFGTLHADEIGQALEPAHRLVYGYGVVAWEWQKGIRSWFLPGVYAGILATAKLIGIDNSLYLVSLIYLFNLILSLVGVFAVFLIGKELGGKTAALIAGLLAATSVFVIRYSLRPLGESVSLNFILLALALTYKGVREEKRDLMAWAGLSLGLSFLLRFPSALFFLPALIFVLLGRRRLFWWLAVPLSLVLLLGGLLDLVTWGSVFHAPIEFFKFNVLENKSAVFGTEPVGWYFKFLFRHKFATVFTALFFAIGAYRSGLLFSSFLLYLAAFSLVPHKEERFLIPLVSLSLLLVSLGIERATKVTFKQKFMNTAVAILFIVIFIFYPSFKVRMNDIIPPNHDMFLGLNFAGRQPDLKGVVYMGYWHDSGGYSCLHRNLPVIFCAPDSYGPESLDALLSSREFEPDHGPYLLKRDPYSKINIASLNYAVSSDLKYEKVLVRHGFALVARRGNALIYKRGKHHL